MTGRFPSPKLSANPASTFKGGAEPVTHLIEIHGLVKKFGPVEAVKGISFTVDRGEVLGFLGPNGAGKSTTM